MNGGVTSIRRLPAGLWLVALALVLRAVMPSGFMLAPAQAGDQAWRVILCTATGVTEAYVDADGKRVDKPAAPAKEQPCAFAGLAGAVLAPAPLSLPLAFAIRIAPATLPITVGIGTGLPAPPPPATGPPHLLSA